MCLKHRPDTFEAWKYRANAKFADGDLEGAMRDYQNTMELEVEDFSVLNNYAVAQLSGAHPFPLSLTTTAVGQFDESVNTLRNALKKKGASVFAEALNVNFSLAKSIAEKRSLPRSFEPQFLIDPVFEKDVDKKMREVAQQRVSAALKQVRTRAST